MNDLLKMVFEAVTQHIPHDAAWIPFAGLGFLGLFGLVLLARGAKLAPALAAVAFLALGGLAGSFVAHAVGTPLWPSIIVVAAIGFGLGLVLFKLWLAILVAACFAGGALSLYTAKVVTPHVGNYSSWNLDAEQGVYGIQVPEAGGAAVAAESSPAALGQFWTYLSEVIPSFQTSVWAIVLSTGLAGLFFGLLLPKAARALFAATAGTFCSFVALVALLDAAWPTALAQLKALGAWGWVIVGVVWAISLVVNLLAMRKKQAKKAVSEEVPAGKAATA